MAFSLHGVHLLHRKNTAGTAPIAMPTPKTVTLPMGMHIGASAVPVVKVGDHVDVGTLVAEQNGKISSPIYSSVSGTVKAIGELLQVNGKKETTVVIESDGADTVEPTLAPPVINGREDLLEAIRKSGVVGLGGAGFPTYVKFDTAPDAIEELIVNGAECEPYITSDSVTMEFRAADMAVALKALETHFGIKKVIIGVENNKKTAIANMQELAKQDPCVQVAVLPAVYPQGGEKVLIYHTTGKAVPAGKLPLEVGCVVINCTTLAVIGEYLQTGMPLVKKCVTVDGSAVAEPKNVILPVGTAMEDVFAFCGGFKSEPGKVLYGGPMMGVAVTELSAPVMKNTNAILAFDQKEATPAPETACIRCGACYNVCPFGIDPAGIERAYKANDLEAAERLGLEVCMECGCCAYVCPAKRPLVQSNRLAKAALHKAKEEKKS